MKYIDKGDTFTVTVLRREVGAFRSCWPRCYLPDSKVAFTFDKTHGELVDICPTLIWGNDLLALSHDAHDYGLKKMTEPRQSKGVNDVLFGIVIGVLMFLIGVLWIVRTWA